MQVDGGWVLSIDLRKYLDPSSCHNLSNNFWSKTVEESSWEAMFSSLYDVEGAHGLLSALRVLYGATRSVVRCGGCVAPASPSMES